MTEKILCVLSLNGDICEFGCSSGNTSKLIGFLLRDTDKRLWLYDSFEGLPEPSKEDNLIDDVMNLGRIENYKGTMKGDPCKVLSKIQSVGFNTARLKIIKGMVEDTVTFR